MTLSPMRFGILGFGLHAERRLVPAFARSSNVILAGLWRRNPEAARESCKRHGIGLCFESAEALCGSPDVDAVFITSPDRNHLEDALLAIRHGKAVLCEKPLAMNAAEAATIVAAADEAGVLFGVAQNFRYNRSLEWMRAQIAAGVIGAPQHAQAQFFYPAGTSARKWIANTGVAAGGPIADVGVHCVDALRFVLGQEVTSVSALGDTDDPGRTVDVTASMQLAMTGGVYGHVATSGRSPYRTLVEVSGSDGVLTSENGFSVDRPVEVVLRRKGDVVETKTFDNGDGYTRMLDAFAAALGGGEAFLASGLDGVRNMRVIDAAYRSLRSGAREAV